MNLKNYTSETPVSRSVDRIEKRLVDIGARSVVKEYDAEKRISGITFCIDIKGQTVPFKMPANVPKVFDVLWRQVRNPHRCNQDKYWEQAERCAWKIISDWVDIQASIVMMEQAEFLQVFMPYLLLPSGKTAYNAFVDSDMKLLGQ